MKRRIDLKKYYSAVKPYDKHKKPYIAYKLILGIYRLFYKHYSFIWKTEKPTEPCVFMSNHTKVQAPFVWMMEKADCRIWSFNSMLYMNSCRYHIRHKVLQDSKFVKLLSPLIYLLSPLVVSFYRGLRPIPVYKDAKVKTTYKKSIETLIEGKNVVIFNEQGNTPYNKFFNEPFSGFVFVAHYYYQTTKKLLKFYPTYCAPSIRTIIIGEPVEYNPNNNLKAETVRITEYVRNETTKIAESLPRHRIAQMDIIDHGFDKYSK